MTQSAYNHKNCRTYVKVDLDAICENGKIAKKLFADQKILSVLKADAYGHGIEGVVPAYETFTDWYAVATFEEAMEIRAHSAKPILLFGPVPEDKMVSAAKAELTFTVGSAEYAQRLNLVVSNANCHALCHLKIDTGLNRSGIRWREKESAMHVIRQIRSLSNLDFTGTYTHLACGEGQEDWEIAHTRLQMERYLACCAAMEQEGYSLGLRHCVSTGGALVNPGYRLDMVRLGMLPMGMSYSDESVRELGLKQALTWYSYVAQIEDAAAGEPISYGCTFRADKPMRVGIVTCGYADGYRRAYSNKAQVIVGGKRVAVLGRVAMDYTMIDLTDVADAEVGMEVIMLGSDGDNWISPQALSPYGESVSGEVTCAISRRVPREYVWEGRNDV